MSRISAPRLAVFMSLLALAACDFKGCTPQPEATQPPPATSDASPAPAPAPSTEAPPAETPPATPTPSPELAEFTHDPAGVLQTDGAIGVQTATVYVPGMRFPMKAPKAYANSQVYGHGGGGNGGPPVAGGQCDAANYSYPWRDNFCEKRKYKTPLCPSGTGHQGQDIRPNKCMTGGSMAVATESGVISQIVSWKTYLTGDSGRTYIYMHLDKTKLKVHVNDRVTRGQELGPVSNYFGTTPTTYHLHFEIKQPVTDNGATIVTNVPPYGSLIDAYTRLLKGEDN